MTDAEAKAALRAAILAIRPDWKGKLRIRYTRRPDFLYNMLTISVGGGHGITQYSREENWWDNQWDYSIDHISAQLIEEIAEQTGG
jgi:hypothetical protein